MLRPILAAAVIASLGTGALVAGPASLVDTASLVGTAWAASSLGDLSGFRKIVLDTQALVDQGDLLAAKARIKDLETSWDEAEPSLKPRAASDWHTVDKAIDAALSALRASTPEAARCRRTLVELLNKMDAASKPS